MEVICYFPQMFISRIFFGAKHSLHMGNINLWAVICRSNGGSLATEPENMHILIIHLLLTCFDVVAANTITQTVNSLKFQYNSVFLESVTTDR